jgi:transcriptional regulator with XRE-family HTH domain
VNNFVKTAEQIEFAEIFERLEKAFNLSKADVARALRIERSYVSMLIKGQRTPHLRTLESMRELEKKMLAGRSSEIAEEGGSELNRLFIRLTKLERTDPVTFAGVKRVIESLVPASSKPTSVSSRLLKKAAASVSKPDPK